MAYPEHQHTHDPMAEQRLQATDAVLSVVIDRTDTLLPVHRYYAPAERNELWQDYAAEYSHVRRLEIVSALGSEERIQHPSQGDVATRVAGMVLTIMRHELDARTQNYNSVLGPETVPDLSLSETDEKSVGFRLSNYWSQLSTADQLHAPTALGQVSREILFANALFRLMRERDLIVEAVQPSETEASERHLGAENVLQSL